MHGFIGVQLIIPTCIASFLYSAFSAIFWMSSRAKPVMRFIMMIVISTTKMMKSTAT